VLPRFYAPDAGADRSTGNVTLSEEESRHARLVLRLRPGDGVSVFNGRGGEWRARVTDVAKTRVTVALDRPVAPAKESAVAILLLQAVLKGDHMDAVIRDATMLGVREIWPVLTDHTVVSPRATSGAGAQSRWDRVAIASSKQCRRAVVPAIAKAAPVHAALADPLLEAYDVRVVLAEPAVRRTANAPDVVRPASAVLAVGPEGGWSPQELARFDVHRFDPMTLGALTLRADAAATVALSILRERWKDL
jgi:16S rRNA (uracil1498-N3)-methyltransferase